MEAREGKDERIARTLGARLYTLRIAWHMSRLEIVQATSINWKRLNKMERGLRCPKVWEVLELARLYRVKPSDLLAGLLTSRSRTTDPTPLRRKGHTVAGPSPLQVRRSPAKPRQYGNV